MCHVCIIVDARLSFLLPGNKASTTIPDIAGISKNFML